MALTFCKACQACNIRYWEMASTAASSPSKRTISMLRCGNVKLQRLQDYGLAGGTAAGSPSQRWKGSVAGR